MNHPAHGHSRPHSRRDLLKLAGCTLLVGPVLGGCTNGQPGGTAVSTTLAQAGRSPWASGGTAAIGAASRYPSPFSASLSGACQLTCMTTIGPCHAESPEREDISDGWDGLPLRLAFRVVDSACRPVPNAIVEIWHTNYTGGYSGDIVRMCTNDQADLDKRFFRGWQRTDAEGIVHFNTCYPGWYRSRAVHIHLRVQIGDYDADDRAVSSVTTQLLFSDALNEQIFGDHPLYQAYGQPDTQLDTDNVVGGETDKGRYLFDVQRMDDGVMFAHKTLVVRQSLEEPICQAQGARGMGPGRPGGDGGRPGPGMGPPPEGGMGGPASRERPPGPPR